MSSGLLVDDADANSPAITAPAKDRNASSKYFSSATNTRSSGDADAMLATPPTVASPSPTRRAPTASAISRTDRFIAPTVSQQVDPTEALRAGSGAQASSLILFLSSAWSDVTGIGTRISPAPPEAPDYARFRVFMDSAPTICTKGLTRRFGDLLAVDGVNLQVAPGQFFGFLGPNGAGKSTTIKMLTGLLAPSSGQIEILGLDLNTDPVNVKRQIGVVPEGMALFGRLTGSEFLNFAGRMYGLDRTTAAQRAAELLDFMQLADQPKKLVTDYSHGMQKKLAMAAAVIHGPKVLFLDEPFEGVDAIAAGTLKSMLQGMIARGATIFLTSHVLEIVERLCSHVAIIHQGRLVAQGSLEELRAGVEAQALAAGAGPSGDGASRESESAEKLTLEEIFLRIVGGSRQEQELSWLG